MFEFENTVGTRNPEEIKFIKDSIQIWLSVKNLQKKIKIKKSKNLQNAAADNLLEYCNHIHKEKLNKIDKDLRLNYFLLTLITNIIVRK